MCIFYHLNEHGCLSHPIYHLSIIYLSPFYYDQNLREIFLLVLGSIRRHFCQEYHLLVPIKGYALLLPCKIYQFPCKCSIIETILFLFEVNWIEIVLILKTCFGKKDCFSINWDFPVEKCSFIAFISDF